MERRKFLELAFKGAVISVFVPLGCGDGTSGSITGESPATSYNVGDTLKSWDSSGNEYQTKPVEHIIEKIASGGQVIWQAGGLGQTEGNLNYPEKIIFDGSDKLYVLDSGNCRIVVFDGTGGFLYNIGGYGITGGGMNYPRDIVITENNILYVANSYNHAVNIYTTDGSFVGNFGSLGSGSEELNAPRALAIDRAEDIHVIDRGSGNINVFSAPSDARFVE